MGGKCGCGGDGEALAPLVSALDGRVAMMAEAVRQMFDHTVLAVETWVIPASGVVERSWHVTYRAVALTAASTTQPVTLASSPAAVAAPAQGPGVAKFAAGKSGVAALAGNTLAIYGNAGDVVTIQVYARPVPPAWGA